MRLHPGHNGDASPAHVLPPLVPQEQYNDTVDEILYTADTPKTYTRAAALDTMHTCRA
jgi:hypothetical protein